MSSKFKSVMALYQKINITGVLFAWKVSYFYEKVLDFFNFGECAAILIGLS